MFPLKHSILLIIFLVFFLSPLLPAGTRGTLYGTVQDTANTPIQNARVRIVNTTNGGISRVDGSFTIPRIPAGEYTVKVSADSYIEAHYTVHIVADSNINLSVFLSPTSTKDTVETDIYGSPKTAPPSAHIAASSSSRSFEGVGFSIGIPVYHFDANAYNSFCSYFGTYTVESPRYIGCEFLNIDYYFSGGQINFQLPILRMLFAGFQDTVRPALYPSDTNGVKTKFGWGLSLSAAYSLSLFSRCCINIGARVATESADMVIFRNAYRHYSSLAEDIQDADSRILRLRGLALNVAPIAGIQYFLPTGESVPKEKTGISLSLYAMYNLNWYRWKNGNTLYTDVPNHLLNGWGAYIKLGYWMGKLKE